LWLCLWFLVSVGIPWCPIATHEAGDTFWIHVLAVYPESSLFALGGALLLLAKHEMDFFGFDVLSNMPCSKTIFVLFFSNGLELGDTASKEGIYMEWIRKRIRKNEDAEAEEAEEEEEEEEEKG
jgi:hypothetical protein